MLVSIVTICLNERSRIEETLESFLVQTYLCKELIVIDGGSTDGTLGVLETYKHHIACLVSEPDGGVYQAMNKGLLLAKGEYVLFLNGGDKLYDKEVLSELFVREDVSEDIVYGDVANIYPTGEISVSRHPKKIGYRFLANYNINHQATFYKTRFLLDAGCFSTEYRICSDYDFLLTAIFRHECSLKHVDIIVSYFYKDGLSSTEKMKKFARSERVTIQKKYLPSSIYRFTIFRYWLIENMRKYIPEWGRTWGNFVFNHLFKPKDL